MLRYSAAALKAAGRRWMSAAAGGIPSPQPQPEILYTGVFVDNEWRQASSGRTFPVLNPSTGETIAQVQEGEKVWKEKRTLKRTLEMYNCSLQDVSKKLEMVKLLKCFSTKRLGHGKDDHLLKFVNLTLHIDTQERQDVQILATMFDLHFQVISELTGQITMHVDLPLLARIKAR